MLLWSFKPNLNTDMRLEFPVSDVGTDARPEWWERFQFSCQCQVCVELPWHHCSFYSWLTTGSSVTVTPSLSLSLFLSLTSSLSVKPEKWYFYTKMLWLIVFNYVFQYSLLFLAFKNNMIIIVVKTNNG